MVILPLAAFGGQLLFLPQFLTSMDNGTIKRSTCFRPEVGGILGNCICLIKSVER